MNVRAPAFLVVALALFLGAAVTSAFGQPTAAPRAQNVAAFPAQDRYAEAMRDAASVLEQALTECRTTRALESVLCEREARDLHRNLVGLAKARLAHDFALRG